ncbi:MAG: hypothetical protein ABI823_09305 [Bryobacteraceae bacterium]
MTWHKLAFCLLLPAAAHCQQASLDRILEQVDLLKKENQRLNQQLDALRQQVVELKAANTGAVATAEKLDVVSQRIEDLDNSKVEADQKFPVKLSGLVLMNSYYYAGHTGGAELPLVSQLSSSQGAGGGTFRNTQLAFAYTGPKVLGAQVAGRLQLDFFGGSLNIQNHLARIRTADVSLHWASRSLTFAVDKPIFNPREPDSLSQLGVPLLANSGNLWLWQPQLRYEERVKFTENAGIRARIGVYQTNDSLAAVPAGVRLSPSRPALQGRVEFFHGPMGGRRYEIAPGFHVSNSLVAGASVASYAVSVDWLARIAPRVDWTGFAFTGQNLTGLGVAGLRQAFAFRQGRPFAVRGRGGWMQTTFHATSRWDVNLIAGMQDDFNRDVAANGVARNLSYAANLRFRLTSNVVLGPEIMQIRTTWRQSGVQLINRYDLALGYLF